MTQTACQDERFGIGRMAEVSGLSKDTLRWYEREGMLPSIDRGPDGYRRYTQRTAALVLLLTKLKATGMPTAEMKEFASLVQQGAASHRARVELLTAHRARIEQQRLRLEEASTALEDKISHYQALMSAGLDCDGALI